MISLYVINRDGGRGLVGAKAPAGFLQSPPPPLTFYNFALPFPFLYFFIKKKTNFLIKFKHCSHLYFLYNCIILMY